MSAYVQLSVRHIEREALSGHWALKCFFLYMIKYLLPYMGERLLKRLEEQKVLIVISDGMPCGPSFYSQDRDEDTAIAIKTYRKKGINIFGAVVDDWEDVSRLYGEEYSFECMDGEKLERQLIRLVKKYLKRNQ